MSIAVVAALLLAGCASPRNPLLVEADAAQDATLAAMRSDGNMTAMVSTIEMVVEGVPGVLSVESRFDLHRDDSFAMTMTVEASGQEFSMKVTCTPFGWSFTGNLGDGEESNEVSNLTATCLDVDLSDADAMSDALARLLGDGFDGNPSGDLDVALGQLRFEDARREGDVLVASLDLTVETNGIDMELDIETRFMHGLARSSTISGSADDGDVTMTMEMSFEYGERTPLPA